MTLEFIDNYIQNGGNTDKNAIRSSSWSGCEQPPCTLYETVWGCEEGATGMESRFFFLLNTRNYEGAKQPHTQNGGS